MKLKISSYHHKITDYDNFLVMVTVKENEPLCSLLHSPMFYGCNISLQGDPKSLSFLLFFFLSP